MIATMFGAALKASAVLCLGLFAHQLASRASASVRHSILAASLIVALATPIIAAVVPHWSPAPAPPVLARLTVGEQPLRASGVRADSGVRASITSSGDRRTSTVSWRTSGVAAAWVIWLSGVAGVAIAFLRGARMTRRVLRDTQPADAPLQALGDELATRLDIRRPTQILISDAWSIPFTARVRRPVIVLPREAREWPRERTVAVLTHELAHVRRADCAFEHVAWLVCAVYWFQPLAWRVAALLRADRERCSDDLVLSLGTSAVDYAEHLVELADRTRGKPWRAAAALAMTPVGPLERRVREILDDRRARNGGSRAGRAVVSLGAIAIALPIAAFQFRAPASTQARSPSVARDTLELPIASNASVSWQGPIAKGATLSLRANMGAIVVDSSLSGLVELTATRKAGSASAAADTRVAILRAEDGITLCSVYVDPSRGRSRCEANSEWGRVNVEDNDVALSVRVPPGVHVRVQAGNGDVRIASVHGDVYVLNGNGFVSVSNDGAADLTTYTGTLDYTRLPGGTPSAPASLRVLHGSIAAAFPHGADVDARTDTGLVRVAHPHAGSSDGASRYRGRVGDAGTALMSLTARVQRGDVDIRITP